MEKKKKEGFEAKLDSSFAKFMTQPHIAAAMLVFALIALFLSLQEFSRAISY